MKGESENANSNAKQLSTLLVADDGQYVKEHYEQVDDPPIAHRHQPIYKPGDTGTCREQDKTNNPIMFQYVWHTHQKQYKKTGAQQLEGTEKGILLRFNPNL